MCGPPPPVAAGISGPRQQNVIVRCYDYYMNGLHAGRLFLKEPIQQCSWWSSWDTDLRTDWHGQWVSYDGAGFVATFDWSGCPSQKHVVIYHNHQGNDYQGRDIRVEFTGRLAFDDEIADYVVL